MMSFVRSPWTWLFFEVVILLAIVAGILPHSAVYIFAGSIAFLLFFLPLEQALVLFLASAPIAPALPLLGFESFAAWRIWILTLFIAWFIKDRPKVLVLPKLTSFEWIAISLGIPVVLSLLVAEDPTAGLRKLLFIVNILLLYPVIRSLAQRSAAYVKAILRGLFGAVIIVFGVALIQYIIVQFASLFEFWHGWSGGFIPLFYGEKLGRVLSESNTWFSYYPDAPPTLRLFSIFPDSHSFALFSIFILVGVWWIGFQQRISRLLAFLLAIVSSLGIFLSGSRGTWIAALVPFTIVTFLGVVDLRNRFPLKKYPPISIILGMIVFFSFLLFISPVGFLLFLSLPEHFFIWVGILFLFLCAGFLFFQILTHHKITSLIQKAVHIPPRAEAVFITAASLWLLFFLMFPLASFLISNTRGAGVLTQDEAVAFERARTIFDISEVSNRSRIQIWLASLESIKQNPLLGVGFGNYGVVLNQPVDASRRGASAHNLYLDIATEAGFFAGLLALAFFLDLFVYALQKGLFLPAFLVAWVAIYNLVDVVLLNDRVFIVFIVFVAILATYRFPTHGYQAPRIS